MTTTYSGVDSTGSSSTTSQVVEVYNPAGDTPDGMQPGAGGYRATRSR